MKSYNLHKPSGLIRLGGGFPTKSPGFGLNSLKGYETSAQALVIDAANLDVKTPTVSCFLDATGCLPNPKCAGLLPKF